MDASGAECGCVYVQETGDIISSGGGIYLTNAKSVTLTSCSFSDNRAVTVCVRLIWLEEVRESCFAAQWFQHLLASF